MEIKNEEYAGYNEDIIIAKALDIIRNRIKTSGNVFSSPTLIKDFIRLNMSGLEHEEFHVLFLDVKNRLIAYESMFRGTLTHTSVYPREVLKRVMHHNSASIVLIHNHPSGQSSPSDADKVMTKALQTALALIDVRVLDHFISAGMDVYSFAENGDI